MATILELFSALPSERRGALQSDFIADCDPADLEELVFLAMDRSICLPEVTDRLERQWYSFLDRRISVDSLDFEIATMRLGAEA